MVFEAHVSRGRMFFILLGSVGFVVLGYWLATAPPGSLHSRRIPADLVPWLGWTCILLFGFCCVMITRRIWRGGLIVRVDEAGILWPQWSARPIGWDNVAELQSCKVQGQKMVGVLLHDDTLDPPDHAKAGRANEAFGFARICISMSGADKSFDQLFEALENGLAAQRGGARVQG